MSSAVLAVGAAATFVLWPSSTTETKQGISFAPLVATNGGGLSWAGRF